MDASTQPRHPELVSGSICLVGPKLEVEGWMLKRVQHDDVSDFGDRLETKSDGKVMPVRICALDQIDLPLPVPTLELFFTRDGVFHVAEHLESNQSMNTIAISESVDLAISVLPQPRDQITRDADVECAIGLAGKDVDARIALEWHGQASEAKWTLKQVQGDEVTMISSSSRQTIEARHAELDSASIVPLVLKRETR